MRRGHPGSPREGARHFCEGGAKMPAYVSAVVAKCGKNSSMSLCSKRQRFTTYHGLGSPELITCIQRPVETFQRRMVLSREPEAMVLPSGLNATLQTSPVWPSRTRRMRPVLASHSRTVRSVEPDAMVLTPGRNATLVTQSVCPISKLSERPEVMSHSRTVWSAEADTRL